MKTTRWLGALVLAMWCLERGRGGGGRQARQGQAGGGQGQHQRGDQRPSS